MDSVKGNDNNHLDNTTNTIDQTEKGAHHNPMPNGNYADNSANI